LQATGVDARGRKQYRYHAEWERVRDEVKYDRIIEFARALPTIRKAVARDLKLRGLPREKVLAAVVRLLETTLIRVGNDEYAQKNDSFGLTTLQDKHVKVKGKRIVFDFRGKSGIKHEIDLHDQQLATIVGKCQELPGQELLQYLDEDGSVRDVGSSDVNDYLREISGGPFTAKDFRTWAGTALAARALQEFEDFDSNAAAKRRITSAIEQVAKRLGNTKAVCRKCYVHPAVIQSFLDRRLVETLQAKTQRVLRTSLHKLTPEEGAVLGLLEQWMKNELTSAAGSKRVTQVGKTGPRPSKPAAKRRTKAA
jgi:DNA topoisomerase I